MTRLGALLGIFIAAATACAPIALAKTTSAPAPDDPNSLTYDDIGKISVIRPQGAAKSVAVLFSGVNGWDSQSSDVATALSQQGALVLGIDWKAYKKGLDSRKQSCNYPSADVQGMVQYSEKKLGLPHYIQPILVGLGEGGSAVYPIYAQPPADTFKGALAVGFCPELKSAHPMCKGHSPDLSAKASKNGYTYAPEVSGLEDFVALEGVIGQACHADEASAFVARIPGAHTIPFDPNKDQVSQIADAYNTIVSTKTAFEKAQPSGGPPVARQPAPAGHVDLSSLDDLPLTVVPSGGDPKSFVIFMTGDGGWAGIDQTISEALAAQGVEIVGFNTLDYFWEEKTPQQTASDLNRVFDTIRAAAPDAKVEIVGFSFGAEVTPVIYPLFSDTSKAMISRLVLLVPGKLAVFEFSTSYWLGAEPDAGDDVAEAVRKIPQVPVLCVYSDDDDGACPTLAGSPPPNVTAKTLGSGHHFSGLYDDLATMILAKT